MPLSIICGCRWWPSAKAQSEISESNPYRARNRKFESISLQQRVCEPSPSAAGCRLQAERLLLEAIEQNANNAWARSVMMGLRRRLQDPLEESVSEWETAIALDPNNTAALLQFGYTLMHLGRPEEAIPIIERGIHLSPYDAGAPGAYQVLGVCHLLLGHIEESIELLRRLGP